MATVNRALVTLRRFFGWLVEKGHVPSEPGQAGQGTAAPATCPQGDGAEPGAAALAGDRTAAGRPGWGDLLTCSCTRAAGFSDLVAWNSTT